MGGEVSRRSRGGAIEGVGWARQARLPPAGTPVTGQGCEARDGGRRSAIARFAGTIYFLTTMYGGLWSGSPQFEKYMFACTALARLPYVSTVVSSKLNRFVVTQR